MHERLRPPRAEDAQAVLGVLIARDVADLGRPDITLGDLLDVWGASDFDLARDAVVCELDGGELAGYAIARRGDTFGAVHPEHEGRGVGTALLDWCEQRQRELGWSEHRTALAGGNERGAELVRSRGYRLSRSYWRMTLDLADAPPAAAPPDGLRLRAMAQDEDPATIHEISNAAFANVAGVDPEPLGAFSEEHLQAHDLDRGLSLVAEDEGSIVGFLLTRRWAEESAGYVDLLAVHPREHGRGIGRALLLGAFAAIREAGLAEAQLGVAGDNSGALRLYESVGMRPRFQIDLYERPVAAGY